jgi:hypothetical protein
MTALICFHTNSESKKKKSFPLSSHPHKHFFFFVIYTIAILAGVGELVSICGFDLHFPNN